MYRSITVFGVALLAGCSLVVEGKLEDKLVITGEDGNHGPFSIGEQITIRLTEPGGDRVTHVLIGERQDRGAVCPGQLEGKTFRCVVSTITPHGDLKYFALQDDDLVQFGPIQIRRLVAIGGAGTREILLLDSATLETRRRLQLPGKLTRGRRLRWEDSGRFGLVSYDDPAQGGKPTPALLEPVAGRVTPLRALAGADTRAADFEPNKVIQGQVPAALPARTLWVVDAKGDLRQVALPEPPAGLESGPPELGQALRAGVGRVRWILNDRRQPVATFLVGASADGRKLFTYTPADKRFAAAASAPAGKVVDLSAAHPGEAPDSKIRALVLSETSGGAFHLEAFEPDTKGVLGLVHAKELKTLQGDPLEASGLSLVSGTRLVGVSFTSAPKLFVFGRLHGGGIDLVQSALELSEGKVTAVRATLKGAPRLLVRSGDEVGLYDTASEQVVVKPFTPAELIDAVHVPATDRFYALSYTVAMLYSYDPAGAKGKRQERSVALEHPITGGWVVPQP